MYTVDAGVFARKCQAKTNYNSYLNLTVSNVAIQDTFRNITDSSVRLVQPLIQMLTDTEKFCKPDKCRV